MSATRLFRHVHGSLVAVEFAACGDDQASRDEVFRQVHDDLIAHCPRRFGPVVVSWYAASAAPEQLRIAGLEHDPAAQDLLDWLRRHEGSLLVLGMVEVPA